MIDIKKAGQKRKNYLNPKALERWDPVELLNPHSPISVGRIKKKRLFDGVAGATLEVNEFVLKRAKQYVFSIPHQFVSFSEPINIAFERFKLVCPKWMDYFAQLTIRRGWIQCGTAQRNKRGTYTDQVHVDGPQFGLSHKDRYPGDIVYIAFNKTPTIFYSQPFYITENDLRNEVSFLTTMMRQANENMAVRGNEYTIYEIDSYTPHRASNTESDVYRIFFRLRFTLRASSPTRHSLRIYRELEE